MSKMMNTQSCVFLLLEEERYCQAPSSAIHSATSLPANPGNQFLHLYLPLQSGSSPPPLCSHGCPFKKCFKIFWAFWAHICEAGGCSPLGKSFDPCHHSQSKWTGHIFCKTTKQRSSAARLPRGRSSSQRHCSFIRASELVYMLIELPTPFHL